MDVNYEAIMSSIAPALKTLLWVLFAGGSVIGFGYFLLVVMTRKKWYINIWEEKADGAVLLVRRDILVEKRFNKGKQVSYTLKRARAETIPPPVDTIDTIGRKSYANYIRVLDDYIPMRRNIYFPDGKGEWVDKLDKESRKIYLKAVRGAKKDIKSIVKDEAINKYIYAPLNRQLVGSMVFTPIDYDVNMMRINAIDNRDKIYADKKEFWEKYGTYIALGVVVVLIIVVTVLSYEYSAKVLQQSFAAAEKVGGPLGKLVDKFGGTPPPG